MLVFNPDESECDAIAMPTTSTNTYQLPSIATTATTTTTTPPTTNASVSNTPSSTQTPALREGNPILPFESNVLHDIC